MGKTFISNVSITGCDAHRESHVVPDGKGGSKSIPDIQWQLNLSFSFNAGEGFDAERFMKYIMGFKNNEHE